MLVVGAIGQILLLCHQYLWWIIYYQYVIYILKVTQDVMFI